MFKSSRRLIRVIVTLAILVAAGLGLVGLWNHYLTGAWTRDGQVQANVVSIAPEVAGRIVDLAVADNQLVRRGDLLYEIDPFDYQVSLAAAQAGLRSRQADLDSKRLQAKRRDALTTLSTSEEEKQTYNATADMAEAAYATALTQLSQARINLERTKVVSPVNGYVTNLLLRQGDYATTGTRNISVLDSDSFWVAAYFEETKLRHIRVGDPATVALMGYAPPVLGHVESVARGINSGNYAPGTLGLASVDPVFTWVRLAQRIPVRIHIDTVPDAVLLAAGMTATVTVGKDARRPDGWHGLISRVMTQD